MIAKCTLLYRCKAIYLSVLELAIDYLSCCGRLWMDPLVLYQRGMYFNMLALAL